MLLNKTTHDKAKILSQFETAKKKCGNADGSYLYNSRLGEVYRSFDDIDNAIGCFQKASSIAKNDFYSRGRLVYCYLKKGNAGEAEKMLTAMIGDAKKSEWNPQKLHPPIKARVARMKDPAKVTETTFAFLPLFLRWVAEMEREGELKAMRELTVA